MSLVEQEPATIAWFALRLTIGVRHLDVPDDTGRPAHVSGRAAEALDRPVRAGAG
jgi:hypothetical protein